MKRSHLVIAAVVMTIAAVALAAPTTSQAATTTTLAPDSYVQVPNYGATVGDIASLAVLDQTGTDDTPANYVELQTPTSKKYTADFTFSLPTSVYRHTLQAVQIEANYFGPLKKQQTWTWYLYNWRTKKWIKVGTSALVTSATTWTLLTFNVKSKAPSEFVDAATRQIKVRIKSSNAKYDAKLDYLAVVFTTPDAAPVPTVGGCPVFPANNIWNARIDMLPVEKSSAKYVASIGKKTGLHPDFGAGEWNGAPIGIPYNLADNSTPAINFLEDMFWYGDESDTGNYPIPNDFLQEGNGEGDAHILTVNTDTCHLYELYAASIDGANSEAGSGAIWDLNSNAMRPDGWTSSDAAGLPILPGLARYDEVASGRINHALRFTSGKIRDAYIWPASHHATCNASATNKSAPPMGQRFRLKASYVIPENFSDQTKVILTALKEYGMILADCGSSWYISGAPDEGWDNDALVNELRQVPGSAFEAVDVSSLRTADPNSYAVAP